MTANMAMNAVIAPEAQAQKLVTAEELLHMPPDERYELVKGVLVDMSPPPGSEHGAVANAFAYRLTHYVLQSKAGMVFAAETGFRLSRDPDTVRAADVAFVRGERMPETLPRGYLDVAPDLVAEVVSPGDDADRVQGKVRDWIEAGVRLVVVVYPGPRQVMAYQSLRQVTVLTEADTLTAPGVLPGFSLPVADLFA
jgi:Uma2 family endonuclease